MHLNIDQQRAMQDGQPVPVIVEGTECILIRKDVYDRSAHLVYDDSAWTAGEIRAMASRAFDEADTAGPIQ